MMLKRPWPVGTEPSPEVFAQWFRDLSAEDAVTVAKRILVRQRQDTDCYMNDHLGQLATLRRELDRLHRKLDGR